MAFALRDVASGTELDVTFASRNEARVHAHAWQRGSYDDIDSTIWRDTLILDEDTQEVVERITTAIDPRPPKCTAAAGHDWQTPHALVGGLRENPGVFSSDHGGIRMHEVCSLCGTERILDTGATRPDSLRGQSVRFEAFKFASQVKG